MLLAVDRVLGKTRNERHRFIADDTTLFPVEMRQYEPDIIRELLNNCIAHADAALGERRREGGSPPAGRRRRADL